MIRCSRFSIVLLFASVLLFHGRTAAQVSIAPTTLFTNVNGITTCYITNPSDIAQEVDLSFLFGYPMYDDLGELRMVYNDSSYEAQMGLGDQIRAFPRSFILEPLQQQVVRIQVRPNRNNPDGMYFTRLKISSKVLTPDAGTADNSSITSRVNFRFDQIIAVFSKQGTLSTSLELGEVAYERVGNQVHVLTDFKLNGNAPYLGSALIHLKDPQNQAVAEQRQTVAFYLDGKHKVSLDLPEDFAPGGFELEIEYTTERADINASDLVQAKPVRRRFPVVIPFIEPNP